MGNYETADAVYDELGGVLREALSNEAQLARLRKADAIFQFTLTEPEAVLTFHARAVLPAGLETGETKTVPDLVFAMEADVAKALLLNERSPVRMLAGGEIAIKGSATKVLQVLGGLVAQESVTEDEPPVDEPVAGEPVVEESEPDEAEAEEAEAAEADDGDAPSSA